MADTVKALRQDMDEESSDEFAGFESHGLVPVTFLLPIVFPLKGDPLFIVRDQTAISDGDAMSITGQIGEHCLGTGEGAFGIDHPINVSHWLQVFMKGLWVSRCSVLSEEL